DGASFGDVAGGATLFDDTGLQFIVGATRLSSASSAVLRINVLDSSNSAYGFGTPAWLTLSAPRQGAAAAWVLGRGLVVIGGNPDPSGAGIEVTAPQATKGTPLPFPADGTVGAGAAPLDGSHVIVAGGVSFDD